VENTTDVFNAALAVVPTSKVLAGVALGKDFSA
jgi:hypothetical protein